MTPKKIVLLTLLVLLAGCWGPQSEKLTDDPGYVYGDEATYEVSEFYKDVCSGKGTVVEKIPWTSDRIYYHLEVPKKDALKGCPKKRSLTYRRTDR